MWPVPSLVRARVGLAAHGSIPSPMPADLKPLADEIERQGRAAEAAGETAWALRCYRWALALRVAMEGLTVSQRSPKLSGDMDAAHREAISRAHLQSPPMAAARKAGYKTLADIAAALDVSKSFVSQVFARKKP